MSCTFDLEHYRELLAAAQTGGYRFAFFDSDPRPGDLLLRHDVDLSLEAALAMAELEAELGAAATYFLMTRSEFYNLASPSGEAAIERLRRLGHRVGLHAVYPDAEHDARFDPVLAWHNPDPDYLTAPVEGFVNAMQAGFFDPEHYRSDSNQRWRHGCPHEQLGRAGVRLAPASRPPGDLGLPGRDDARDDAVDARRRARPAPRPARGRPHRSLLQLKLADGTGLR